MQSLLHLSKKNSLGLLLFFCSLTGFAQKIDLSADLLLVGSSPVQSVIGSAKRAYVFKNQPKTFRNSNPVSLLYGGTLYLYQNFLSRHFSADCLFDPSCSDFSKQAVKEFGLLKGGLLTFDRLSRCNRIAATSLDPALVDKKSHKFNDPIMRYK